MATQNITLTFTYDDTVLTTTRFDADMLYWGKDIKVNGGTPLLPAQPWNNAQRKAILGKFVEYAFKGLDRQRRRFVATVVEEDIVTVT